MSRVGRAQHYAHFQALLGSHQHAIAALVRLRQNRAEPGELTRFAIAHKVFFFRHRRNLRKSPSTNNTNLHESKTLYWGSFVLFVDSLFHSKPRNSRVT